MKKSNFFSAFMILIMIITIPVSGKITGTYLYGSIGACYLAQEIEIPGTNTSWIAQTDTKTGLHLNCGGGYYDMWANFRMEFDLSYRKISIADLELVEMKIVGQSFLGGEGNATSLSFMLNGWYDFDIRGRWGVYFGGGLGVGLISLKNVYIETAPVIPNPIATKTLYINDSDWRLAMQAGAGITYALKTDLIVDLGYRYFRTPDPRFITEMGEEFFTDMQMNIFSLSLKFIY